MSEPTKPVVPQTPNRDLPVGSPCIWLQNGNINGPAQPAIVLSRIKPGVFALRVYERAIDQPRNVGHYTGYTPVSGARSGAWATIEEYHAWQVAQEAERKSRSKRMLESQQTEAERARLQKEAELLAMYRGGTPVEDIAKFFCTPISDIVEIIKRDEQAKQRNEKKQPAAAK